MVAASPPLLGAVPRVILLLLFNGAALWLLMDVFVASRSLNNHAMSQAAPRASDNCSCASAAAAAPKAAAAKVQIGWAHSAQALGPRPASGLTIREAQEIATDNSGNLVWSLAARRLLDPDAAELVPVPFPYDRPVHALLFPEANLLVDKAKFSNLAGYTSHLLKIATDVSAPIMLVGIGTQVNYEEVPPANSTAAGSEQDKYAGAKRITLADEQQQLLRRVVASGGFVSTRGHFTGAVIKANGLPPPLVLGCPSLMLNHNPRLGEVLQQKWEAVLAARDPKLRLAITLPNIPVRNKTTNYPKDLFTLLVYRLFKTFPNSAFILQTPRDENTLEYFNSRLSTYVRSHRARYYYDVESWIDGVRNSFDFVIGWRIHGQMAALAAEVPGLLIAPDWRITELADTMQLPAVDMPDLATMETPVGTLNRTTFNLFDFAAAAAPHAYRGFDANRQRIAAVYAREFERLGVPLHPGVQAMARQQQQ